MEQINLIVDKKNRLVLARSLKTNFWLGIFVSIWLAYLLISSAYIEFNLYEINSLKNQIAELKNTSEDANLNQKLNFLQEKEKSLETAKTVNANKKILLSEINRSLQGATILGIEDRGIRDNKLEIRLKMSLLENQSSSPIIENLKQNSVFSEVKILNSMSTNGIKQIEITLIRNIEK